jgi:hypothetical protein
VTSTLVVFERLLTPTLPTTEATFQALPDALKERSARMLAEAPPPDPVRQATRRRSYEYMCETVRAFALKGGLIMAGTDSYYLTSYPGDLHRELELLVSCGANPW